MPQIVKDKLLGAMSFPDDATPEEMESAMNAEAARLRETGVMRSYSPVKEALRAILPRSSYELVGLGDPLAGIKRAYSILKPKGQSQIEAEQFLAEKAEERYEEGPAGAVRRFIAPELDQTDIDRVPRGLKTAVALSGAVADQAAGLAAFPFSPEGQLTMMGAGALRAPQAVARIGTAVEGSVAAAQEAIRLSQAGSRLIPAGFAVDVGRHIPEQLDQSKATLSSPDATFMEKVKAVVDPAFAAGLSAMLATHAAKAGISAARIRADMERTTPEQAAADIAARRALEPSQAQERVDFAPSQMADIRAKLAVKADVEARLAAREAGFRGEMRAILSERDRARESAVQEGLNQTPEALDVAVSRTPFDALVEMETARRAGAKRFGASEIPSTARANPPSGKLGFRRGAEETASNVTDRTADALRAEAREPLPPVEFEPRPPGLPPFMPLEPLPKPAVSPRVERPPFSETPAPSAEVVPVQPKPPVAPAVKPPEPSVPVAQRAAAPPTGAKAVAQRMVNAEEGFIPFAMRTGELTRAQATAALAAYRKNKAIKIDPIGGQYSFTHGGFAERDVLRRAAGLEEKSPAGPGVEPVAPKQSLGVREPDVQSSTPAARQDVAGRAGARPAEKPPELMTPTMIRGNEINRGDEVSWMSGGSWDGIVLDAKRKASGKHDVLVNAIDGNQFWLKDVEDYGFNKGRSRFVDEGGYVREGDRYVFRPVEPVAAKPPAAAETGAHGKQPWEMTKAEWRDETVKKLAPGNVEMKAKGFSGETTPNMNAHANIVKNAFEQGKPVPPEVLADYPALAPKPARTGVEPSGNPSPKDVLAQKQDWGVGGKEGAIYSADYSASGFGTERTVSVKDAEGRLIGQRDPFYPQGIPPSEKARKTRIAQVAREIVKDHESANPAGVRPAAPAEPVQPVAEAKPALRDWDLFYEDLVGDLDAFSPARHSGMRNYELDEVAQRFVDYAKADQSGRPLADIVAGFAKRDTASASQIRKLKESVKNLTTPAAVRPAAPAETPAPLAEAKPAMQEGVSLAGQATEATEAWGRHSETVVKPLREQVKAAQRASNEMAHDARSTLPGIKSNERLTKKAFLEKYGVSTMDEANALFKEKQSDWQAKLNELDVAEKQLAELSRLKDLASKDWSRSVTREKEALAETQKPPDIIARLEAMKRKPGGELYANPFPAVADAVWNTGIDLAVGAIKAGRKLNEAIDLAVEHILKHAKGLSRDDVTRAMLEALPDVSGARPVVDAGTRGRWDAERAGTDGEAALARARKVFSAPPPDGRTFYEKMRDMKREAQTGVTSRMAPLGHVERDIYKAAGLKSPEQSLDKNFEQLGSVGVQAQKNVIEFEFDIRADAKKSGRDFNPYMFLKRTEARLERAEALATEATRRTEEATASGGAEPKEMSAILDLNERANKLAVAEETLVGARAGLAALREEVGPEKWAALERAGDTYQNHMNRSLRRLLDAGRISQESYDAMVEHGGFYAPFRVMKYVEDVGTGRAVDSRASVVKALEGITDSEFRLADMMVAGKEHILRARVEAEKAIRMRQLGALAELDPDGNFIRKLPAGGKARHGREAVTVFEDGKPVLYEVDAKVAQAVKGLTQAEADWFVDVLGKTATPFKLSATGLNVVWQGVNIVLADAPTLALVSRFGLRSPLDLVRFPLDFAHGIYAAFQGNRSAATGIGKPNALWMKAMDSGALSGIAQAMLTPEAYAFRPTKGARNVLHGMMQMAGALEQATKVTSFKRGLRLLGEERMSEIVTETRRYGGSPDFPRHGQWVENVHANFLSMFFNARLQGIAREGARAFGGTGGRDAAAFWIRTGAVVGVPAAMLWAFNHSTDELREEYDKLPQNTKENYFPIPKGTYIENDRGERMMDYWLVPKREFVKAFANTTEGFMSFADKNDPEGMKKLVVSLVENASPVNIGGRNTQERLESAVSSLHPLARGPFEAASGRDFWRHRDIVPDRMKESTPGEQYTGETPEAYKMAARLAPDWISPLRLENVARNMGAGLVTQFFPRKPVEGREDWEQNRFLRRFQRGTYVDDAEFMEQMRTLKRGAADEGLARERGVDATMKDTRGQPPLDRMREALDRFGPDRATLDRMKRELISESAGRTRGEDVLLSLPVKQRAEFILGEIGKMPVGRRLDYIETLYQKGILTEAVGREMAERIQP